MAAKKIQKPNDWLLENFGIAADKVEVMPEYEEPANGITVEEIEKLTKGRVRAVKGMFETAAFSFNRAIKRENLTSPWRDLLKEYQELERAQMTTLTLPNGTQHTAYVDRDFSQSLTHPALARVLGALHRALEDVNSSKEVGNKPTAAVIDNKVKAVIREIVKEERYQSYEGLIMRIKSELIKRKLPDYGRSKLANLLKEVRNEAKP